MHCLLVGLNVPAFKTREVNKHISGTRHPNALAQFLAKTAHFSPNLGEIRPFSGHFWRIYEKAFFYFLRLLRAVDPRDWRSSLFTSGTDSLNSRLRSSCVRQGSYPLEGPSLPTP